MGSGAAVQSPWHKKRKGSVHRHVQGSSSYSRTESRETCAVSRQSGFILRETGKHLRVLGSSRKRKTMVLALLVAVEIGRSAWI